MNIKGFFDERTFTISYVVWDADSKDAVLIDTVLDFDPVGSQIWDESIQRLIGFVREHDLMPRLILETHAHADHISGSQNLKKELDAPIGISERISKVQEIFKPVFDLPAEFATDGSQFDLLLRDGGTVDAGTLQVGSLATPGHTPACQTLQIGDAIFTGDALLMPYIGTGRCDFPGGSAGDLYDSVTTQLYTLPDATRVFVAHDYPNETRPVGWESTIGKQKAENVRLAGSTTKEQFLGFRKERDATLKAPRLLYQSVQANIDAGRLPERHGKLMFSIPISIRE
jgi:glyoxylase-like metal-dependent hydrolase (beta-lactamase superfamily II)